MRETLHLEHRKVESKVANRLQLLTILNQISEQHSVQRNMATNFNFDDETTLIYSLNVICRCAHAQERDCGEKNTSEG